MTISKNTLHLFSLLGWVISSLLVLFQVSLQTSTSVMIHDLEKAFSVDLLGVSLLASSYFYTYLFLQIPAGMIIDRYGVRVTLAGGLFLAAFSCFIFAKSHMVSTAIASRIILGIAAAPGVVAALYLTARCFPARYFALIAGLMECLGMLGGVVGESVMARFVTHYGWRETLFGCAIFAFTLSCLAAFLVRDPVRITTAVENNSWQNLLCVIRLPQAWVNGLVTGCIFAILASFAGLWCVPYLMHHYHVSLHQAADGSSLIFIGAALGAPFLGWLSDHLCIRKTLMIIFSGLMLFIMLIILYIHLSFAWINFYLLLLGFTSGVYVLPFAVMRDITPHHVKGTAMGYTNMMCIIIGAPLLTPMVGWILTLQPNQYRTSLVVFPISLLFALILSFFVRETYCQSTTGDK